MDTKGKKFLVAGAGRSGIASAELLLDMGEEVLLYDGNADLKEDEVRAKSDKLSQVRMIFGELKVSEMGQLKTAVLSPGIPTDLAMVNELREHNIPVWGEVELAYRYAKGRVLAVTGTNGKTTTTALLGEILKNYFSDVQVAGNIGIPYTSIAPATTEDTVTALEISSFQLETIHTFCPDVSVILNITPDHLNRHHTMENYIAAKESVAKNQKPGQTCVLNYEDMVLREFGKELKLNVIYFSSKRKLDRGLYLDGDIIVMATGEGIQTVVDVREMKLLGVHNYENVMAAVAAAYAIGVPLEKIVEVLKTFQAVAHRIEYVAEIAGVRYYNDSKATNTDAAIKGILAMDRPTYLIGGGYDKQSEYGDWIDAIKAFPYGVRKLVLIGETKEKIAQAAKEKGFDAVVLLDTFEEAIQYCHENAKPNEAVLLSPACASWDMFPNYEKRGETFKEIVCKFK